MPVAIFARSIKILQITDIHLDLNYSTKGDRQAMCHLNEQVSEQLGQFGDY
ncbi:unnamed protein product, partial [Gongylonema pulchrum]|uniref:3',5'-cyclic-nucleotide phosphodiesterase n=1 Tax=Gongylonema pulchrum TaxID=637853 RepID=A0A183EQU2_9BILA